MDIERIRATIEPTVEQWLRDNGIPRDKSHDQLVNRIVAAIVALQEKPPPTESNRFACGD